MPHTGNEIPRLHIVGTMGMGVEDKQEPMELTFWFNRAQISVIEGLQKLMTDDRYKMLAFGVEYESGVYAPGSSYFYDAWWALPQLETLEQRPAAMNALRQFYDINQQRIARTPAAGDGRGRLEVSFATSVNKLPFSTFDEEVLPDPASPYLESQPKKLLIEASSLAAQSHQEVVRSGETGLREAIKQKMKELYDELF